MSNSKLVNYTLLSPNCNKPRNHTIDTITIHHMAGDLSVETCGAVFAKSSRGASANYGIDSNGRVGLYVDEANRSWATSSTSNDNRAVTIEVANDKPSDADKWHVSDKALAKLIDLCVDICKRNGIKKLNYTGDKSGNLTMHKWFAATACPGPYLESKFPYIAEQVNKKLGSASTSSTATSSATTTTAKATIPDMTYRVRAGGKWYPAVKNLTDYAGVAGKKITDVALKVSKGSVKYRVHVKGGGWLPYVTGYNINNSANGYAGNGKAIDAIEIYYFTPSALKKSLGYSLRAKYRVSPTKGGYYSWQYDNETSGGQDGYAGCFGKTIDRFQLVLSK